MISLPTYVAVIDYSLTVQISRQKDDCVARFILEDACYFWSLVICGKASVCVASGECIMK